MQLKDAMAKRVYRIRFYAFIP